MYVPCLGQMTGAFDLGPCAALRPPLRYNVKRGQRIVQARPGQARPAASGEHIKEIKLTVANGELRAAVQ